MNIRLTESERREISELASRATDGQLDAVGQARLEALLKESASARAYYIRFMGLSAELAWAGRAGGTAIEPPVPQEKPSWRHTWGQVWAAAAVLVLAMFGAYMMLPKQPAKKDAGVATLTNAVSLEWDQAQEPDHVANVLKPGWLRLKSGLAQVEFISGTSVWIEGPASFRLDSPKQGYFASGRMVSMVPHGSEGFRVEFPHGAVVDHGTAFALDLKPGLSVVHVFEGSVIVTPTNGTARTYIAGQAVALDDSGKLRVMASDSRVFDDMGFGWSAGTFGQLNTAVGPGHPRHGSDFPWNPAWGPQIWKGYDPLEAIGAHLGVDAARWDNIKPVLSNYLEAQWELRCSGFVTDDNDFSRAAWDLWLGIQKPEGTDDDLSVRLDAYRQARRDVRWRRDQWENELRGMITTREEAVLVDMGYMR